MYTETSQLDNRLVEQYHLPIQQHQHLGWKEQPELEEKVVRNFSQHSKWAWQYGCVWMYDSWGFPNITSSIT
jgi:hypothetical protein